MIGVMVGMWDLWHFKRGMYKMLVIPGARDHQSVAICVLSLGNTAAPCSEAQFTFKSRHVKLSPSVISCQEASVFVTLDESFVL